MHFTVEEETSESMLNKNTYHVPCFMECGHFHTVHKLGEHSQNVFNLRNGVSGQPNLEK
eukprot:m.581668 g.581668  ORF g.581668 m.581668 type:complete len:59 (+) comp22328_c0_seq1:165-341(+)